MSFQELYRTEFCYARNEDYSWKDTEKVSLQRTVIFLSIHYAAEFTLRFTPKQEIISQMLTFLYFRFNLTTDPDRPARHEVMIVMKTEAGMYIKAKLRKTKQQFEVDKMRY